MSDTITNGSKVTLRLMLSLEDGTVIEQSGDEPDTLVIGQGEVIPGLEGLLSGLSAGDAIKREIKADQKLFGDRDDDNVQIIPLTEFDESIQAEAGEIIEFALPNGQTAAGRITQVDEHIAVVDFNHPLAGRNLLLEAEIISVKND